MSKGKAEAEDPEHELEEAVNQALRWFDSRHRYNSSYHNGRRLHLDFRHLVIGGGDGIDVKALSSRIRAKVPDDVPIHMSLQCCRMDDGGLEVMDSFVRNIPNLTSINVTLLWFDYHEISNVVQGASDLKKLELPLGNRPDISLVFQACKSCQLEDLRFFANGYTLEIERIQEVVEGLPLLMHLKELSFVSFKCHDDCFDVLLNGILNLPYVLDQLHLSCLGGITSTSLPMLTKLLRKIAPSTQSTIRIRNTPQLFQEASLSRVEDFMMAVRAVQSLKWLELDNVGLRSSMITRLFRALECPHKGGTSAVVTICGPNILRGKAPFRQMMESLPRMHSLDCLAVIDTLSNLDQVVTSNTSKTNGVGSSNRRTHAEMVSAAVFENPVLRHLTLRIGDDCIYPKVLDEFFERNSSISKAKMTNAEAFIQRKQFPLALWPLAIESVANQGGRYGADPVYLLLQHFFATCKNH